MSYYKFGIEEVAYLVTHTPEDNEVRFPNHTRNQLQTLKRYYVKKLKENQMEQEPSNKRIDKLAELLERSGIEVDNIAKINRVNLYQGYIKNPDGEFETIDLVSAQYVPKATESDFISQADPVKINPTRSTAKNRKDEVAIILPDIQAGFRKYDNQDELEPIHDERALDVALQIIKDVQPDQVVLNGDNLDLPNLGRFAQENAFFETTNASINYVHQLLAKIRANAPDTRITYIAGNHEERLKKQLMQHVPQIRELRIAGTGERPLTIPFLLNLSALEVDYVSGYPSGAHWLTDDLKVIHGDIAKQGGGMTANAYLKREDTSTIYGHVHRIERGYRTHGNRSSGRFVVAASFGCLARIDGAVPSYHSGVDEDGRPVKYVEDWQQGLGVVEISKKTGSFAMHDVHIQTFNNHEARHDGKIYTPNES